MSLVALIVVLATSGVGSGVGFGRTCVLPRARSQGLELVGPDICSSGIPFDSAGAAATAAGFPVPSCWGHGGFYVHREFGTVYELFPTNDVSLTIPPPGTFRAGPISGNALVIGRVLTVHGVLAWGYQNDRGTLHIGSTTLGTTVRSLLTWNEDGVSIILESPSIWTLKQLNALAETCVFFRPSPGPIVPNLRGTLVNWNDPLPGGVRTTTDLLSEWGVPGAYTPALGTQPTKILTTVTGSARHPSRLFVFAFDIPDVGHVLVYERSTGLGATAFHDQIIATTKRPKEFTSAGYFRDVRLNNGLEALLAVADRGAPASIEVQKDHLDLTIAGQTLTADQAIALANML